MLCFCSAWPNVRPNGFSIGPTPEERFVFEVFWNFNSSITNGHSFADISFCFPHLRKLQSEEMISAFFKSVTESFELTTKLQYYLDSRPARLNNIRNLSSSYTEKI